MASPIVSTESPSGLLARQKLCGPIPSPILKIGLPRTLLKALSPVCKPAQEEEQAWTTSFTTSSHDIMVSLQSIARAMISFFTPAGDIAFSANILPTVPCFYRQVFFLPSIFFAQPQDG